jgi:hypothetical protein
MWAPSPESSLRGWIAVNLFLLLLIGTAAALLFLSLKSIQALGLDPAVERVLMAAAAIASLFATGTFGKALLGAIEKRSRA